MKASVRLDESGKEIPDPTPVEWPLGLSRPLSLQDEIKRFVRSELSRAAAADGFESFEEANDFEVDDDEGDMASAVDVMELQADKRYQDALEEFDAGLAQERERQKSTKSVGNVSAPEAPQRPAGAGKEDQAPAAPQKSTLS